MTRKEMTDTDDDADREAAELLPCSCQPGHVDTPHTPRCWVNARPAVAARLRERDERVVKLTFKFEGCRRSQSEMARALKIQHATDRESRRSMYVSIVSLRERIAVLESQLRERDEKIAEFTRMLIKYRASVSANEERWKKTYEAEMKQKDDDLKIAKRGWEANVDALRLARERIAALEAERDAQHAAWLVANGVAQGLLKERDALRGALQDAEQVVKKVRDNS